MKLFERPRSLEMERATKRSSLPIIVTADDLPYSKIDEVVYCSDVSKSIDANTGLPTELEITRETFEGQKVTKKYVLK